MPERPTGTVTFLFTDIQGSTALLRQLGRRYSEVLAQHERILREAFTAHGGHEVDTQGDAFFVAFARANDAVAAAVDAQRDLAAHEWPDGVDVNVRMGLHTGQPQVGEQRYVGMGVHKAARIGAAGHGGQVLLSNATRELVEDDLPDGVSAHDLGQYQLRDLDRPERLFALVVEGLPGDFPPLKAPKLAAPRPPRRRALLLAALAGVVAAAIAIPIFALAQGGGGKASVKAASGNSVAILDPKSARLSGDVAVGTTPTGVANGAGSAWVTNAGDGTVDRIDLATRMKTQTIAVDRGPSAIAFGAGSVWVANSLSGTVSRIDPGLNRVSQTIPVGNGPSGIAVGEGKIWVVNQDDHSLTRIDADTGSRERTFTVGAGPVQVAVGAGGVWLTSEADGKVLRVDARTGDVLDTLRAGRGPGAIAVTRGAVWVANSLDGTVSRIDPGSSTIAATVGVGEGPSGIAADAGSVWVSNQFDGSISRIDPATNRVSRTFSIGGRPTGVAADPAGVFVAVRPAAGAHRGGTLTVLEFFAQYGSLDPQAGSGNPLLSMTNDGLTAFKRVGGRESTQLVPDLALSLPEPSDAGKAYTFRLRPGIRYSTGKLVQAADFRRAVERAFQLHAVAYLSVAYLYSSLVGAGACLRKPKRCDLSKGVVTDNRVGTVTFRLTEPDPDLPAKLALPGADVVPPDTPGKDMGTRPLPATGPYRIASYVPKRQARLVRNPYFREWSPAARPEGYPDEIVVRFGVAVSKQIAAVARGEADIADLTFSGAENIPALRVRYGALVHSSPVPLVVYTFLNTRLPPFNDVRVRRALNYAVDREAIVRAAGGSDRASATCQVLPQNYPGYRPYCPRRDLAKAKRLVAASGTRGAKVVVWARASYQRFFSIVVGALRALGYHARLKLVSDANYYDIIVKAGPHEVQAGYVGLSGDYPSAALFIQDTFSCSTVPIFDSNLSQFCDRAIDRKIKQALKLQRTDLIDANELWARIDRMLVAQAPVVPLYNARVVQFVSPRVGNYQFHQRSLILLDQIWVR